MTIKSTIEEVTNSDVDKIKYAELADDERWRVDIINELTDVKFGQMTVEGFTTEECDDILHFACTS